MKIITIFSPCLLFFINLKTMDYHYNPINHSTIRLINRKNAHEIDQVFALLKNKPFKATKTDIENKINNPDFTSPNSKTPGSINFLVHFYTRNPLEITGIIEYIAWQKTNRSKSQIEITAIITSQKHKRQNIASQLIEHIVQSYGFDHDFIVLNCDKNDQITEKFLEKNKFKLHRSYDSNRDFRRNLKNS